MDVVEFRVGPDQQAGLSTIVTPYVNGTSLIELAGHTEVGAATEGGERHLAGSYAGLTIDGSANGASWYLNDAPQSWFGDGDSCLLGCECGETGCWPLTAAVAVTDSEITWSRFRTGHRSWDLSGLGPFAFRRDQYVRALTAAGGYRGAA